MKDLQSLSFHKDTVREAEVHISKFEDALTKLQEVGETCFEHMKILPF